MTPARKRHPAFARQLDALRRQSAMTTFTTEARDLQVGDRIVQNGTTKTVKAIDVVQDFAFLRLDDGDHIGHYPVPADRPIAKVTS